MGTDKDMLVRDLKHLRRVVKETISVLDSISLANVDRKSAIKIGTAKGKLNFVSDNIDMILKWINKFK